MVVVRFVMVRVPGPQEGRDSLHALHNLQGLCVEPGKTGSYHHTHRSLLSY